MHVNGYSFPLSQETEVMLVTRAVLSVCAYFKNIGYKVIKINPMYTGICREFLRDRVSDVKCKVHTYIYTHTHSYNHNYSTPLTCKTFCCQEHFVRTTDE